MNNVGTISTCSLSTNQYIIISIDGSTPDTTLPSSINNGSYASYFDSGTLDSVTVIDEIFSHPDSTASSAVTLLLYLKGSDNIGSDPLANAGTPITIGDYPYATYAYSDPTPFVTNITEYGEVGQYISGNFTATFNLYQDSPAVHVISCSFRVERTN